MNLNQHYITCDERGHHCFIDDRHVGTFFALETAMSSMSHQGYRFDVRTVADSGKPTWWYVRA